MEACKAGFEKGIKDVELASPKHWELNFSILAMGKWLKKKPFKKGGAADQKGRGEGEDFSY